MNLQLYFEDTVGQKHIFHRELDNDIDYDELEELLVTFNMLLASCGYSEYVTMHEMGEMEE